jgi:hypothetical protein
MRFDERSTNCIVYVDATRVSPLGGVSMVISPVSQGSSSFGATSQAAADLAPVGFVPGGTKGYVTANGLGADGWEVAIASVGGHGGPIQLTGYAFGSEGAL